MLVNGLDGVLFDLDGVLVDSRAPVERHWKQFAEWFDLHPAAVLAGAHGRRSRDTISGLLEPSAVDAALELFEMLEIADMDGVAALPGAAALLGSLPRTSWGVVTSASAELAASRMQSAGLPTPQLIVSAGDVAAGKPDPAGYLLGARRLGVSPPRCAGIEDSPAGLLAAKRAGLVTIALTTTHSRDELIAEAGGLDLVLADLSGLELALETV